MLVLFDNGTPRTLARYLIDHHTVTEARARGWKELENGALLTIAEASGFEVLITTDKNLRYQQNLMGRKVAIVADQVPHSANRRGRKCRDARQLCRSRNPFQLVLQHRPPARASAVRGVANVQFRLDGINTKQPKDQTATCAGAWHHEMPSRLDQRKGVARRGLSRMDRHTSHAGSTRRVDQPHEDLVRRQCRCLQRKGPGVGFKPGVRTRCGFGAGTR